MSIRAGDGGIGNPCVLPAVVVENPPKSGIGIRGQGGRAVEDIMAGTQRHMKL